MLTDRWSEIDRLFQAALEVPLEERTSFLSRSCPSDPELRNEVLSLVVRYQSDGGRLENTVLTASAVLRSLGRPALHAGEPLAKYEILSTIGAGGMGDVYLARDVTLDRKVALKVLTKGLGEALGGPDAVFAEARAASSLNHPNIITVFEAGEADGRRFIAAEYVDGVTVRNRLLSGPVALHEGLAIAVQVARALSAAHAAGVVHRDVKPENIMLRRDAVVKVLDFGIARMGGGEVTAAVERPGRESADAVKPTPEPIVGSLAYMSPEQALGTPLDARSDIFSFGTFLFELFTGTRPFTGGSNLSILMAVVSHPAVFPAIPRLPKELRRIIERCLAKNPGDRPQRMDDVAVLLEGLRERREPAAIRKRRIRWAARCGISAALAAAAFWWAGHPITERVEYTERPITRDQNYKDPVIVATDSAVYFHEVVDWKRQVMKLSLAGGELSAVDLPGAESGGVVEMEDYSAKTGNLLYRTWTDDFSWGVFHTLNEESGKGSIIPGVFGYAGNWSPDGTRIALFSRRPSGVFLSDLKGTPKLVYGTPAPGPWRRTIGWSRDGRSLRFVKSDRLYEVSTDGGNPHLVFDSPSSPQGAGRWTPDGSRFIFSDDWTGDLWSATQRGFAAKPELTRLTTGQVQFGTPAFGPDGKIYAVGQYKRGRLNRYDAASETWEPAIGGLSVDGVDYSRDGKMVAYVGFPRREVEVSHADGSGKRGITSPPLRGYMPRFSPDGKQLTFMGKLPGKRWRIYLSSLTDDGPATPLPIGTVGGQEPNWSPDGSKIIYATVPWDPSDGPKRLYQYDLASKSISAIPGSEGLYSPRWSPDGKFIVANKFEFYGMNSFVLVDPSTGKRTEFPENIRGVFPAWSNDSRSVYFLTKRPLKSAAVFKLSIEDGSVGLVAQFQNRIIANSLLPSLDSVWMGLTPDESPLLLEDTGLREIYEIFPADMARGRGNR